MKAVNYILFISLVAFSLSCKKKDIVVKACNNSFLASKIVPGDSLELISVNVWGKKATTYPLPSRFFGFNKNENCVYSIRFKDTTGEIHLYRLDLESKKIDTLTAINTPEPFESYIQWGFFYNDVVKKFYLSYFFYYYHSYMFGTREVSISGKTFTYDDTHLPANRPLSFLSVNEFNGDVYLDQGATFSPTTNTVRQTPVDLALSYIIFNPNDTMLYGISFQSSPTKLYKLNPNTGDTTLITTLPSSFDRIYCTTFDACNNQFVMQAGDSNPSLYWINVKNGSIAKIAPTKEIYTNLTYIPE